MTAIVNGGGGGLVLVNSEAPPPGASPAVILFGASDVDTTTTTRHLFSGYAQAIAPASPVVYFRAPRAGTLRNFFIQHNIPGVGAEVITYTIRIGGFLTAVAVTLAANAQTDSNVIDSVAVAQGALIDVIVTKPVALTTAPGNIVATAELAA